MKAIASFLFLCYASILKWFRHSCNRCLNSNQILLIDPFPFHSFLNLNMYETLVTRMVAFSKVHVFMSDQILYWILSVRRRILANYGTNGFGISSPIFDDLLCSTPEFQVILNILVNTFFLMNKLQHILYSRAEKNTKIILNFDFWAYEYVECSHRVCI